MVGTRCVFNVLKIDEYNKDSLRANNLMLTGEDPVVVAGSSGAGDCSRLRDGSWSKPDRNRKRQQNEYEIPSQSLRTCHFLVSRTGNTIGIL